MGTFTVVNHSSLRDPVVVSRIGMYMACHRDALVDTSGKQIISVEYKTVWSDKNIYIVTDYEG